MEEVSTQELQKREKRATLYRRIVWAVLIVVVAGLIHSVYAGPDKGFPQYILIFALLILNAANVLLGKRQLALRAEIANRDS